jgi:hypothetical protein
VSQQTSVVPSLVGQQFPSFLPHAAYAEHSVGGDGGKGGGLGSGKQAQAEGNSNWICAYASASEIPWPCKNEMRSPHVYVSPFELVALLVRVMS